VSQGNFTAIGTMSISFNTSISVIGCAHVSDANLVIDLIEDDVSYLENYGVPKTKSLACI
jgi:hypothetical protein